MTDPTEAEARRWMYIHMTTTDPAEDGIWRAINDRIGWGYSGVGGMRESQANDDVRDAIEHLRATEREKVRALVERLSDSCHESDVWGAYCYFCRGEQALDLNHEGMVHDYLEHTAGCPWVEARLWLARDEAPE